MTSWTGIHAPLSTPFVGSYWGAGMDDFQPYGYCYGRSGKLRKHLNATAAHRDHLHIGMTKRGAAAKTTFWL